MQSGRADSCTMGVVAPLRGVMWQVHLRYDRGFMISAGMRNSCGEGAWIRAPGKLVTFKRAGREIPACVAGVDIQHMQRMSHCVLGYHNYDITSKRDFELLWQLNAVSLHLRLKHINRFIWNHCSWCVYSTEPCFFFFLLHYKTHSEPWLSHHSYCLMVLVWRCSIMTVINVA